MVRATAYTPDASTARLQQGRLAAKQESRGLRATGDRGIDGLTPRVCPRPVDPGAQRLL